YLIIFLYFSIRTVTLIRQIFPPIEHPIILISLFYSLCILFFLNYLLYLLTGRIIQLAIGLPLLASTAHWWESFNQKFLNSN
ncbi:MAG: hypothetical protein ACK5NA_01010, partial [Enterococcus sp.]